MHPRGHRGRDRAPPQHQPRRLTDDTRTAAPHPNRVTKQPLGGGQGCTWRALPHDLPPGRPCWRWWARWNVAGEGRPSVWGEVVAALRGVDRVGKGRAQQPTAAIVDSQSAKSSEGGQGRSFDAHGRVTGRTRHALVDVEGNLLLVGVTGAGTANTAAAPELLTQPRRTCPNLRVVWCDPGYQAGFVEAAGGLGLEAAVVGRQPGTG